MRILAIETSCDETAIALLEIMGPREAPDIKILGNSLFSQAHLHAEYGGVYPNLAKREHQKNLPPLLELTLNQASKLLGNPVSKLGKSVDYICVTQGPGLEPALWTGINFAEELGKKWQKPVIPVDHMEGHIWSVLYKEPTRIFNLQFSIYKKSKKLELPALALLVSGGHTELVMIKDFGKYEILGKTLDDAVGEAFDKVARMLGLTYPGGPKISKLAAQGRTLNTDSQGPTLVFPRPMINSGDLNFSYSGLKTAVLYKIKNEKILETTPIEEVAMAFEDAAIEVLISKTRRALEENIEDIKTVIVAGGVSANKYLKSEMQKLINTFDNIQLHFPIGSLSTDNAVMIALAAYINIESHSLGTIENIQAKGNLSF
ncbi:MAG: tRNA (adenosine(37)-N6)-threonylcarbamoyltransferase complex transferase subunit TsaD [bacterium]